MIDNTRGILAMSASVVVFIFNDALIKLAAVKADPKFKEFKLVRQSRLSVVPVSDEHWKLLMKMSGSK